MTNKAKSAHKALQASQHEIEQSIISRLKKKKLFKTLKSLQALFCGLQ